MKVLILGNGGREHAIAHAVSKSELLTELFILPGNAGTALIGTNIDLDLLNPEIILNFAKENEIDLTIVGPEAPIMTGITNLFRENNLKIFAPTKEAGQIEASKSYAKYIMNKYNIPTGAYKEFLFYDEAIAYVLEKNSYPCVIKYDGLAAGKGVYITKTLEETEEVLKSLLVERVLGSDKIIIEEFLDGDEFTLMAFVNGENTTFMPIARDFKRIFDGDMGNNTGGMGCICPYDKITSTEIEEAKVIMNQTVKGLMSEAVAYTGVLYGGFIATKNGVKVIEFNARFGDPETEVVLQKIKSDVLKIFVDVLNSESVELELNEGVYTGVVLSAKGYPDSYVKNVDVTGFTENNFNTFHMSTNLVDGKYLSTGGRVMCITSDGQTTMEAFNKIYAVINNVECSNIHYRKDLLKY